MISDNNEALTIFNEITGLNELSSSFKNTLDELNLTETDGYIIKLKLNDEIISGKLTSEHIEDRLNLILNKLAAEKTCGNYSYNYSKDILLFLHNQEDNKLTCDECNLPILPIDKYCSHCGSKCTPKIGLFDLLSSINASYIKPGDIIKINLDNTIEKTTFEEKHMIIEENILDNISLESLYDIQIKKNHLNVLFTNVLVLNYIQKHDNISNITSICARYDINDSQGVMHSLINNGLLEFKVDHKIYNKVMDVLAVLDIRTNKISSDRRVNHYLLTRYGEQFLKDNNYILLYDEYFKNSVVDDIVLFDEIYNNNEKSGNVMVLFIKTKRLEFRENNQFVEYLSTFDLEAYYYESMGMVDEWIQTLFMKFIIGLSENYSSKSLKPIDYEFTSYLINLLKKESLSLSNLKNYFFNAYDNLDNASFIFDRKTCFNYLLRCFNGDDINNMNFELYDLCNDL
ncbi:hypothetical protein [Methanosphaera sp. WGK6]|uniref:hypothetical protein n=1 Tax=Methanosphaera sp. WGK6 TaxID=1561964 RepID=UPI00084C3F1A|nr:hypothetical protein [Methanosphaera sp. WGK6]OED29549.1 hypothetical protein NL43_07620 [Methanosphaera sp. WGK6]